MSGFELGDDRVDRCTVRPTALSPVHDHNVNRTCLSTLIFALEKVGYIRISVRFDYW